MIAAVYWFGVRQRAVGETPSPASSTGTPDVARESSHTPMSKDSEVYLALRGTPPYGGASEQYISLLDTIRAKSEWERILESEIESDTGRYELKDAGSKEEQYRFVRVVRPDESEEEAIRTGKKHVTNPKNVARYVLNHGLGFDSFIELDEHVKLYCEARQFQKQGETRKAIKSAQAAVEIEPDDNTYNDLLFQLRLDAGDTSAVDDAVEYYSNDMDSMVHSGRVAKWINALLSHGEYSRAANLISRTEELINDLIEGRRESRRFSSQRKSFYRSRKRKFTDSITDYIGFKSINQIESNHEPSGDFLEFCKVVIEMDSSDDRLFPERVGSAFERWGYPEIALDFYRVAMSRTDKDESKSVKNRIEGKIEDIE